jgi:hypothetical protein
MVDDDDPIGVDELDPRPRRDLMRAVVRVKDRVDAGRFAMIAARLAIPRAPVRLVEICVVAFRDIASPGMEATDTLDRPFGPLGALSAAEPEIHRSTDRLRQRQSLPVRLLLEGLVLGLRELYLGADHAP